MDPMGSRPEQQVERDAEMDDVVLKRLAAVGVPPVVVTWQHLIDWVQAAQRGEDLLRVLRITRDVKAVRGMFEAIIVPLMRAQIRPGAPVDCRVNVRPLGKRLAEQGLHSLAHVQTWREVIELIVKGEVPEATAAPLPGQDRSSVEWRQIAVIVGEATASSSRMLSGSVALGLELQDLGSAAVQCLDSEVNAMLAGCATPVWTRHCGDNGTWRLITDGANLEYVLTKTALLAELADTFDEIDALHSWLKKAAPGVYQIGDEVMVICEREVSGRSMVTDALQQQFNFEMPLDLLCAFMLSLGPGHSQYNACFGISEYFWSSDRTDREITDCRMLATALMKLTGAQLSKWCGTQDADVHQQVRGLMLVFGMCAIHARYAKPGEPAKDLPILCKTNPVHLAGLLLLPGAADVMFAALASLLPRTAPAGALQTVKQRFADGIHPALCRVDVTPPVAEPGRDWTSTRVRHQVLLEIRRAPVHPVMDCLTAAAGILDHFVVDTARQYC